jgi:hypothetical protein
MNSRRCFIKQLTSGTRALFVPVLLNLVKENNIPARGITRVPKFHWFGYYDKLQFDPTNRYVLGMQVDFEMHSPIKDDVIKPGYIDLHNNDKWTAIGESRSWGWQQGCMLRWVPSTGSEVIWNDRRGIDFVSIIKDIKTGRERIFPKAVYSLSPDGKWAIGTDFSRIQNDTYLQRDTREQVLYLFHEPTIKTVQLGRFYSPPEYTGEWRCDLHPRASNDGKLVCIDSTQEENGRQMYLIDIGSVL